MPFITVPGLTGQVFVPEQITGMKKKHNCPDCFSCPRCGDDRCQICRAEKKKSCGQGICIQEAMDKRP